MDVQPVTLAKPRLWKSSPVTSTGHRCAPSSTTTYAPARPANGPNHHTTNPTASSLRSQFPHDPGTLSPSTTLSTSPHRKDTTPSLSPFTALPNKPTLSL